MVKHFFLFLRKKWLKNGRKELGIHGFEIQTRPYG